MSKTILVVDDDIDYLAQMRLRLEQAGFTVATAEKVDEAKQWLADHTPALAVVDLMMEHFDDGFSLCHYIRQHHAGVPIVMITAVSAETGMQFDLSARGEKSWIKADAVLNKPVRFEQLQREIARLVKD
jgi:DNA-binding response OmpR family regulator